MKTDGENKMTKKKMKKNSKKQSLCRMSAHPSYNFAPSLWKSGTKSSRIWLNKDKREL